MNGDEEVFEKYIRKFPPKTITNRGELFWYTHPAKDILAEDVRSGLAKEMTPAALRQTRPEYQEFEPRTFRKHVHQEICKQREKPYWRHKRNTKAIIQLAEERKANKQQWINKRVENEIDEVADVLGSW